MWTMAHTHGQRETVEECGEQSREPRGKRPRQNGRRERKGEMGTRDNGEKRKQHTARCLPLPKQRKRNSHCNKCNNNSSSSNDRSSSGSGSSKRRNASAVARRPQVPSS